MASAQKADTIRVRNLGEAQVVTNRATNKTPLAFSNLDKKAIEKVNFGQDIPFLLSTLPNVITTSDAGNGFGYTSMRVRGSVGERINVTNNGIPLNDPEAHTFYWVDTPDLVSSVNDLQLQRGVGTSTKGAAAFGASVNMTTDRLSATPYASYAGSFGSFNSLKNTVKVGTGLLGNHWTFDTRLSYLASDGYRDRSTVRLGSYFTQLGYINDGTTLKLIAFGGKERTYHAWDGISKKQLKTDRTYNPNGLIDKATNTFYDNQIDSYFQQHVQALLTQRLSDHWQLNAALHYTYGLGYYEEYKSNKKLKSFGLLPFQLNGKEVKKSDIIRRKYVEGNFGGAIASLDYARGDFDFSLGQALNYFNNDHYGEVLWVKNYIGALAPNQRYYDNTGHKLDYNIYARANYKVLPQLNLFADLQYRRIDYRINGTSDKKAVHDTNEDFNFFNPKFGATWLIAPNQQAYASLSVAHREPTRTNYEKEFDGARDPLAEQLMDYEVGYRISQPTWEASVGGYFMDYKNQLVPSGRLNEIGEAISENVAKSYRLGVELAGAWKPCSHFRWEANVSLSQNKIKNYAGFYPDENWVKSVAQPVMKSTTIAFSPSVVANNIFSFNYRGFAASLTSQYVGRQYLDNFEVKDNSLDAYFVSHLNANYTFKLRGVKEITVGATVYNLFNEEYETNGYSLTYVASDGKIQSDPRFYPMAGRNFLVNLALKF